MVNMDIIIFYLFVKNKNSYYTNMIFYRKMLKIR